MVVEDVPRLAIVQLKMLPEWPEYQRRRQVVLDVDGVEMIVPLETDVTSIGVRWWLACPECGSRRLHLHLLRGRLACRRCLGLIYYKQALADGRWRDEVARPAFRYRAAG